ncbi:hypothetical protein CYY_009432, partial [Polysphondylium violaceum]
MTNHTDIEEPTNGSKDYNKPSLKQKRRKNYRTFNHNPEENANLVQRLTYSFLHPLMSVGVKRPLTSNDMYPISKRDDSYINYTLFSKNWDSLKKENTNRILLKTLHQTFGWEFHLGNLYKLISDLSEFISPFMISKMMLFLQDETIPFSYGLLYSVILTLGYLVHSFCASYWEYKVKIVSIKVKGSLVNAIYKKSLSISNAVRERDGQSKGNTVNLMSSDVDSIGDFCTYGQTSVSATLQIIISIILLYRLLGWSCLVGFATLIFFIPLNYWASMKASDLEDVLWEIKDERASKMSEVIQSIRVLKFYGWINIMTERITNSRLAEVVQIKKIQLLDSFLYFLWGTIPDVVVVTSFSTYILMGYVLDVNTLMTALSLFFIVRAPLGILPHMLTGVSLVMVSVKRVEKFLINEELQNGDQDSNQSLHFGFVENKDYINKNNLAVSLQSASFQWTIPQNLEEDGEQEQTELKEEKEEDQRLTGQLLNQTLNIPKGKLSIIIGPVGSGKSSLLSAILGDMKLKSGGFSRKGRIGYVSQLPWILNGTVRDNIIFGAEFDEK